MSRQRVYERVWNYGFASWDKGGMPFSVFKALAEIECAGCGCEMANGELFTFHKRGLQDAKLPKDHWKLPLKPYCRNCYPFSVGAVIPDDLRF